jgi:hypothetical protein
MGKKKPSKKRLEEIQREAENMPSVRRLRELYERGMAELEAKQKIDPNYR